MTTLAETDPTQEQADDACAVATPHTPIDVAVHAPALVAGLRWLFDTPQPSDAIVHHLGDRLPSAANRLLRFIPDQGAGLAAISVQVTRVRFSTNSRVPLNPLYPGEIAALAELVDDLGVPVRGTWGGNPSQFGGVVLDARAHASLASAVDRYQRGCPRHEGSVFCRCGWYQVGQKKLVTVDEVCEQARTEAAAIPIPPVFPALLDPSGVLSRAASAIVAALRQPEGARR
ncbi:hypothetical protein B5P44_01165 [Mycobacterium sp. CBMA 213]|uniref:Uncharacterized protein n=1 Tax=Mycolicibacterium sp. CBMA 213 TaxID=1968788 RepID=A0A343VRM6_9MYCO|nr:MULTISPECIES: hypothetical protein [unclassified Mycolicibacterium]AVN58550.1 hypothetical protein B5P44_p00255 [Mycolicibacterium sp. CBMA 213]MUL61192.1 hypothetical protein [Mycolicibacterium sp. CBMA 335]MUM03430.1 hypothetical protein [Mycolicibacterium sp. CBMA 213]